jgi:thioredoxin reductase (NADPH)
MEKLNRENDLIIIGSGPAGLAAAIYSARYLMKTLVIGKDFGGRASIAGKIENYPGFKEIESYDLMLKMKEQAENLGAKIIDGKVIDLSKKENYFFVITENGQQFSSKTLIFALGVKRRHLGLHKEKELTGKGVHYCVTCDGPLFKDKTVAMVGGGDSSVKGIIFLGDYAKKIYFIVRDSQVRAEPINLAKMKELKDKVEILLQTQVKELIGQEKLEKILLSKSYQGSRRELEIDGLFIEIGFQPDKELAQKLGLELDEKGYIKVDNMMQTNIKGVFAAGDCTNFFGRFKQIITAAAMGSVAASSAYEYLHSLR